MYNIIIIDELLKMKSRLSISCIQSITSLPSINDALKFLPEYTDSYIHKQVGNTMHMISKIDGSDEVLVTQDKYSKDIIISENNIFKDKIKCNAVNFITVDSDDAVYSIRNVTSELTDNNKMLLILALLDNLSLLFNGYMYNIYYRDTCIFTHEKNAFDDRYLMFNIINNQIKSQYIDKFTFDWYMMRTKKYH